jgi:hypothetical protein
MLECFFSPITVERHFERLRHAAIYLPCCLLLILKYKYFIRVRNNSRSLLIVEESKKNDDSIRFDSIHSFLRIRSYIIPLYIVHHYIILFARYSARCAEQREL